MNGLQKIDKNINETKQEKASEGNPVVKVFDAAGGFFKDARDKVIDVVSFVQDKIKSLQKYLDTHDYTPYTLEQYHKREFVINGTPEILKIVPQETIDKHASTSNAVALVAYDDVPVLLLSDILSDDKTLHFDRFSGNDTYCCMHYKRRYVPIADYWKEVKKSQIAELEHIASKLGAKTYTLHYMGNVQSSEKKKLNTKAKAATLEAEKDTLLSSRLEILSRRSWKTSRVPSRPTLTWFKNDERIKRLIDDVLSGAALAEDTWIISYCDYKVINKTHAAKIDATLKKLDVSTKINYEKTIQQEINSQLLYSINWE